MAKQEEVIQEKVANYLVQNYPDVLFHSDYGSGVKLTKYQSAKQKRLNGGRKSWPDMIIATPVYEMNIPITPIPVSGGYGLFLELKKEGENLYAQRKLNDPSKLSLDGRVYADKHLKEQADVLYKLRSAGYCAEFAIGYDHAISIITSYLGEPKKQEVEF